MKRELAQEADSDQPYEEIVRLIPTYQLLARTRYQSRAESHAKSLQINCNDVLPVTQSISDMACKLVEKYALLHSLHMADALIAVRAIGHW